MKTLFLKNSFILFSIALLSSFTTKNTGNKTPVPAQSPQPELCYLLTNDQVEKMGGVNVAGSLPEDKVQAYYSAFGITPVAKDKLQQVASPGTNPNSSFVCNTPWNYYYTYGYCTANYSRPECGYYVRIRYWKKYRFNAACQYEEVTLSSTVVCC